MLADSVQNLTSPFEMIKKVFPSSPSRMMYSPFSKESCRKAELLLQEAQQEDTCTRLQAETDEEAASKEAWLTLVNRPYLNHGRGHKSY